MKKITACENFTDVFYVPYPNPALCYKSLLQFSPESEFLLWLVHISGSQKLLRGIQVLYKNTQSSCNIRNPKIQAGFLADFLMLQLVHILAFLNDLENTALSLHEFLPHFLCNLCAKAL